MIAAPAPFRRIAFVYDRDVPRLQRFLARMRREVSQAAHFHLGDLLWRIHNPANGFDAATDLPIWVDSQGDIAAFGFYLWADDNPEFFLNPVYYEGALAGEIVDWAARSAASRGRKQLETSCLTDDAAKAAFLGAHGFHPIGDPMVFMERCMTARTPTVEVAGDYQICPLRWELSDLSITGASPMQRDAYAAIRASIGYRPDLDVKAYAGDEIVAGCLLWLDDVGLCGELEPVGTHPEHRRRGLAAACVSQALSALQHHGATKAYVRTAEDNLPAVALYEKMGFRAVARDIGWARVIPALDTPICAQS